MSKHRTICAALIGIVILFVLPGVVAAQEAEYKILPGDLLAVTVWKEEDLSLEVLVRPDGRFSFPLVGDVQAAGRGVNEIRDDIVSRIDTYIPDAVVTVLVREIAGNKAYVVGKVNRPGPFVMNDDTDVMQALSIAGGTTTFAALKKIVILRRSGGSQTAIPFNYNEVEDGERLEQNIVLQPGDVVVVP
jgi:polysaccharide export outer membrane protein